MLEKGPRTDIDPAGSFRTLPTADQRRHPEYNPDGLFNFKFEFACGNAHGPETDAPMPTFNVMLDQLKDNIHFAIQNGDWIYEEGREYPVEDWVKQVNLDAEQLPEVVKIAPSIVGVWENYKIYHNSPAAGQGEDLSKF